MNGDQSGVDATQIFNKSDTLHMFYNIYRTQTIEPGLRGNTGSRVRICPTLR